MIRLIPSGPQLATLLLAGVCARALLAQTPAAPGIDPKRFEADIQAFEAADFPGVPLLNRGFGGSTMADVVFYMDRIVTPYQPRLIVLYADNDMAHGLMPDRVLAGYRALVARLRSALPATRLAFVSIKPSPSHRAHLDRMRETNRRIRADIARDSLQTYVDVFTPMLDRKGQPRPELFEADSLHLTRAGYLLWRSLLAPVVR